MIRTPERNGRPKRMMLYRSFPRAFLLWFALRVFLGAASGDIYAGLTTLAMAVLLVTFAAVGFIDTRRRNEFPILGNLGIPAWVPSLAWAATAIALESGMGLIRATTGGQ